MTRSSPARYAVVAALTTAALLASCTSTDNVAPVSGLRAGPTAPRKHLTDGSEIVLCKVIGPPGTYHFHMDVKGTGPFSGDAGVAPFSDTTSFVFDGTNPFCLDVFVSTASSWALGTVDTVTFTEINLPAGIHTDSALVTVGGPDITQRTVGNAPVVIYQAAFDEHRVYYANGGNPTSGPPSTTCASITAIMNQPITPVTMTASGGAGGPYTFSATGLPPGITISSGGTISGTPTVGGVFNYTVTVTDKSGNTGTTNCSVTVFKQFGIGPSSMEGHLTIQPNTWFNGGYSFKFKNNVHVATQFTVVGTVTVAVTCPNGGGAGGTIVIPLGKITYNVPANNTDWLPTGDQNSILSWMGAIKTPDLCNGHPMDNAIGAVFTGQVLQSPATGSLVDFRFKYRNPAAKGKTDTNCTDPLAPMRNDAATCGASWSQTVTDP